jgi:hypothetical protein
MKSKKKPLVAAAISALLALAGSASAQGTTGSTRTKTDTGRKGRVHARSGKIATKHWHKRHGKKGGKRRYKISRGSKRTLNPQPLPPE